MVRILIAGAVLVLAAIALIVVLRSSPPPPVSTQQPVGAPNTSVAPIAAPEPAQQSAPTPQPESQPTPALPIATNVPSVTSEFTRPVPLPPAPAIIQQQPTPVTTEPELPISGSSPYPAGGKPTGPFDLAWHLTRSGDMVTGSLTVTSLAPDSQVEVEVRPLGAITLRTPAHFAEVLTRRVPRDFPLQASAPAGGSLVITVTQVLAGRLGRSITIDLAPTRQEAAPPSAVPRQATQSESAPVNGVQTIRDASGQVLHLAPAVPGP